MVENVVRLLTLVLAIVSLVAVLLHFGELVFLPEALLAICCTTVGWSATPPDKLVAVVKLVVGALVKPKGPLA